MSLTLPEAPPVEELDGPEFLFTVGTGTFCLSGGTTMGIPLAPLGIETAVNLDGLDVTDFWRRGGPVLAQHKPSMVLGRTVRLFREAECLKAVMRFAKTPLGCDVRRSLEPHGLVGLTTSWDASMSVTYNLFDTAIDLAARRIRVNKAMLAEWSLVPQGADARAKFEGRVILRVITEKERQIT